MRLGIFGGTFDPPHVGHLLVASDACEALGLDRLVWIPAGAPPFKTASVSATSEQRLEMVRRMVNGDPRFEVDPLEIERAGLSYTVDTLEAYADRFRGSARFLLIGEDLLGQVRLWRDPMRVAELAELVVLARPGAPPHAEPPSGFALRRLETRRVDVSSTEIRSRVRDGRPIRGFVADSVADFIHGAGLYR